MAGRALAHSIWSLEARDIRGFSRDRHGRVDDTPFGGGPGMVMRPDVVASAVGAVRDERPLVYLTPRGRTFMQADAQRFASAPGLILLCGRYEGIDQRAIEASGAEELSVGDFVLSGGEMPAMLLLDAAVRLLPGTMSTAESATEESFSNGLLEYPHYTRPACWDGREVPPVLLSGNHAAIAAWRREQSEHATQERRPDLWATHLAEMDSHRAAP